jgi:2-methylisocitrate lyase-like PEP mutase family enzyme
MPLARMDLLLRRARAEGRCVVALECWGSTSVRAIATAGLAAAALIGIGDWYECGFGRVVAHGV